MQISKVTLGCLLSREVWWAVVVGSFWPNIQVFYRPEWTKGVPMKMNFEYLKFRNECYSYSGKSRWKKVGSFVLFTSSLSELWSLNCPKKCIFCNFVLTSARHLSILNQFTYMHLKGLVIQFQKKVLFIMLLLTVSKILGFLLSQHLFSYFNC